jgi:hypothetical protein
MARRETPVARATVETPPYPIDSLSAAATNRRIRSSRKGDKERNRRWISLSDSRTSIKQNYLNLFYLFPDRPLDGHIEDVAIREIAPHLSERENPDSKQVELITVEQPGFKSFWDAFGKC